MCALPILSAREATIDLRSFKVGHNTVYQWRDYRHIPRLSPLHLSGFVAHGDNVTGNPVNRDYRRFVDDHAAATHGDYRAG